MRDSAAIQQEGLADSEGAVDMHQSESMPENDSDFSYTVSEAIDSVGMHGSLLFSRGSCRLRPFNIGLADVIDIMLQPE